MYIYILAYCLVPMCNPLRNGLQGHEGNIIKDHESLTLPISNAVLTFSTHVVPGSP